METFSEPAEPAEKKKERLCVECAQPIPERAAKCGHCGSYQRRWLNLLTDASPAVSLIMVLAAIAQVVLAYGQVREAKKERVAAAKALGRAEEALTSVARTQERMDRLSDEAERNVASIRAIADQVNDGRQAVEDFRLSASQQISNVTESAMALDAEVDRVRAKAEFADMIVRAQNDDRWAYDQYHRAYTNKPPMLKETMESAYGSVMEHIVETIADISFKLDHAADRDAAIAVPKYIGPFGTPLEQIDFVQFMDAWNKAYSSDRPDMLVVLWSRCARISEYMKLRFLADTISDTPNTRILAAACTIMERKATLNLGGFPENVPVYLTWWDNARKAYPEDQLIRTAEERIREEWRRQHPNTRSNALAGIPYEFVTNVIAIVNRERNVPLPKPSGSNEVDPLAPPVASGD